MNWTTVALAAAFGAVVLGLAVLLVSEAVGASESFVVVGGVVALAGVGVLTGVVMRLPDPHEEHGGDHA
ncbi:MULTISPECIES: hypothetical protein [unclassified Haloferax]|uniref:hypothetical protein n=1 Tax=Haloferax TaxID=2251 RepID=UPI0002B2452D|nr:MULTISPECIES: hypothetical protein [unclassified Haloferax]ELZ60740.1 hypothetical protein C460_02979 [Haloferax sp. ATCC BAA-646]ELZ65519.1 hypothetical protein C459_05976 [Haloferax sp. ATCC BAA-645]ELZ69011.1 hypothetical protein C458_07526 [Haloferax sp. ATCC BAA-644]